MTEQARDQLTSAHEDTWKQRGIETPIANERAFKVRLGIGEDAYSISRISKRIGTISGAAGAATVGGTVASSSVVASTFFPVGGLLGLLGLGTAVTPIGWIIAAAALSGVGWVGANRMISSFRDISGPVEVIPKFINSPIDELAVAIFSYLMPLALKIAVADGEIDEEEEKRIIEYFTCAWGYDRSFVMVGMGLTRENLPSYGTKEVANSLAQLATSNRDCNYEVMVDNIAKFLQELIEADGQIRKSESVELQRITSILKDRNAS